MGALGWEISSRPGAPASCAHGAVWPCDVRLCLTLRASNPAGVAWLRRAASALYGAFLGLSTAIS